MIRRCDITCVVCPSSCQITVMGDDKEVIEVKGHGCKRGLKYGESEFLAPMRMVTGTVCAKGYITPLISVRTDKPIPKEKISACMEKIHHVVASEPFYVGKIIIENVCGTDANVVLTNG